MKNRTILLALVVVSGLLYALPAVASAGVWDAQPTTGGFPLHWTGTAGVTRLKTSSLTVTCNSATAEGELENEQTGKITNLVFHTCTGPLGATCTGTLNGAGETSGTITATTPMTFHNIRLEASPSTTIGVLITPKEIDNTFTTGLGHFASFKCAGIETKVAGNGFIGEVTSPVCGGAAVSSGTFVAANNGTAGVQKWQQITTTGTSYHLWSSTGGAAHVTASGEGTGTITVERSTKAVCT